MFCKKNLYYLFLLVVLVCSCSKTQENSQSDAIKFEIVRLDSLLIVQKNSQQLEQILQEHASVAFPYFQIDQKTVPALAQELLATANNPDFRQFYQKSIQSKAGINPDSLFHTLGMAFAKIKAFDKNFRIPKVYTTFTGFAGSDIYMTDSSLVIGLDYFLGPTATYRPQLYGYQLLKYEKNHLIPQILNLYAQNYIANNPADKTLLAEMIHFGKTFEFTKSMLPNCPDSLIIAIEGQKLAQTEASQNIVWAHFIQQKLLYQKSDFVKPKYMAERPATAEISPECPGMIGRWLGWKIVKYWQKTNENQPLKALLDEPNAQIIFEKSNYKGQENE
jgi:hypothetical protein